MSSSRAAASRTSGLSSLVEELPQKNNEFTNLRRPQKKSDPNAHLIKRMVIQNSQRVRKQRFRFDTIDHKNVLKFDVAFLAVQFVVSIIYIGSWGGFIAVRLPRVLWGLLMTYGRLRIFKSRTGICMYKTDIWVRIVTLAFYMIISLGFSVWLPEQFCDLIGEAAADDDESSCKWQVFGFRLVFILLSFPLEFLALAVVYRYATDMIFKIQLRKLTGTSDIEQEQQKKRGSSIAYLMDPDVALNRRNVFAANKGVRSFASAVEMVPVEDVPMEQSSRVNQSERRLIDHQESGIAEDMVGGSFLPAIDGPALGNNVRIDQFDFEDGSEGATDDEGEGNDQIEEIYRQQIRAAQAASLQDEQRAHQRESRSRQSQRTRSSRDSRPSPPESRKQQRRSNQMPSLVNPMPVERIKDSGSISDGEDMEVAPDKEVGYDREEDNEFNFAVPDQQDQATQRNEPAAQRTHAVEVQPPTVPRIAFAFDKQDAEEQEATYRSARENSPRRSPRRGAGIEEVGQDGLQQDSEYYDEEAEDLEFKSI